MLRQVASLEVTSIRDQNPIKKTMWTTHQYFVDFERRIDAELFTSNRCHSFHVDSSFVIDEISKNFRRENSMSNR